MHFNRRKFSGTLKVLFQFWGSKMLKSTAIVKKGLSAVFIELKCGWLQTCLTDMKKTTTTQNTLTVAKGQMFYAFFKYCNFWRLLKIISSTC